MIPLIAAVVTFFAHPMVQRLTFTVLIIDAAWLGLFCVTGTLKALDFHLGSLQAVLLGITTAVGGGMLRDITARETPALVQVDTDLYSIPAAAGAVVVASAYHTSLNMPIVAACAAVLVFVFRIIAMLRHWTAPRAWEAKGRKSPPSVSAPTSRQQVDTTGRATRVSRLWPRRPRR
jgi:uncharacterized membrane protein YeiH